MLILSARTLTEDRIRGMDVGADQYLEKPFDLDELLAMVRNLLLRRSRGPGRVAPQKLGNEFEFGRAELTSTRSRSRSTAKVLRLTSMEMKLLRYFIENEGSVITRAQLLDEVWGLSGYSHQRARSTISSPLAALLRNGPRPPAFLVGARNRLSIRFERRTGRNHSLILAFGLRKCSKAIQRTAGRLTDSAVTACWAKDYVRRSRILSVRGPTRSSRRRNLRAHSLARTSDALRSPIGSPNARRPRSCCSESNVATNLSGTRGFEP